MCGVLPQPRAMAEAQELNQLYLGACALIPIRSGVPEKKRSGTGPRLPIHDISIPTVHVTVPNTLKPK